MFIGSVNAFTRLRDVYNHSKWYPGDVLEVFEHLEVRKHLLMTARGSQRIGNFAVISTWKGSQYLAWTDFWWFSPINHTFCPQKHVLFIPVRFRHPTMTYVNQVYEKRHITTISNWFFGIFWLFPSNSLRNYRFCGPWDWLISCPPSFVWFGSIHRNISEALESTHKVGLYHWSIYTDSHFRPVILYTWDQGGFKGRRF